ncbi:MAG: Mrp/NBP35 family ATP-binding protein [Firmicutes bacterium]|nr:Mrp/NBP35 family ATP-binding protein [Bacillota bacterium]
MTESCDHNCDSCASACQDRTKRNEDFLAKPHELSQIKHVIGVVSGKGGVGKSLITSMLAVILNRNGKRVAILDADITGPSIPKAFGIHEKAMGNGMGIVPAETKNGIEIMSLNLLLEHDTDPVVWRGPVIAGTVKQFWTDVIWNDIDVMLIDMPPGTGDVPLTVFQSIPIDGVIIVTSPQELVGMIVEKAANMAKMMHIPVLGLVENLSYILCPDCGKAINLFGDSHLEEIAGKLDINAFCRLPILPQLAQACDKGEIEDFTGDYLAPLAKIIGEL